LVEGYREGSDEGSCHSQRQIVQSWGSAIKTDDRNDYSDCITDCVLCKDVSNIDAWRRRVEFPAFLL